MTATTATKTPSTTKSPAPVFSTRFSPENNLVEILFGPHHVAWVNNNGAIGNNRGGMAHGGPLLQDVSLSPGGASHYGFFEVYPMPMMVADNHITYDIKIDGQTLLLSVKGTDAAGWFKGGGDTTFEPDPERPGTLRVRQTMWLELLKDLDAEAIRSGKQAAPNSVGLMEVAGLGPCWTFELSDPFFLDCRGPATEMDRDYPYRIPYCSNEAFTKAWHNKYDFIGFEDFDGSKGTLPLHTEKLVLTTARYTRRMKNGGWIGLASKTNPYPASKLSSNEQTCFAICQWIYDTHFIAAIPFNAPKEAWGISSRMWHMGVQYPQQIVGDQTVLKTGRRIEMSITSVLRTPDEGAAFLKDAVYNDVDLEERGRLESYPALDGIKNEFTKAVTDVHDAAAWKPASETIWDRSIGHKTPGSLRIQNYSYVGEGAWAAKGGRSCFGLPIVPNTQYKLSGWIKTHNVQGTGATIEVVINEYENLGHPGEKPGQKFHLTTPPLSGNHHWTYVETTVGPFPENCSEIYWIVRLKSWGVAWFDEVAFEEIK